MSPDRLLLAPIALGHFVLFVLTVNVIHAFGFHERVMSWVKLAILGTFAVLAAWIGREAWAGPVSSWSSAALTYSGFCLLSGLVAFPLSTLYLHHRRTPGGITERATERDLAASLGRDSLIGPGKASWMLRLPRNESFRLRRTEWEMTLPGLPSAFDGLSMVQVTDLHFAPCFDRKFFEAVIDEAATWEADLVLFTGDLVDHDDAKAWIVPLLSRLSGRLGSFAILGNHDVEHDPPALLDRLAEAGFTSLEGRWATVGQGGSTLALAGTSAPWGPLPNVAERPEADYRLLLSHCPDLYYWAERNGFDLMLSGHNHGGQIRLPWVGPVFMPSRYSRRFDRGFFRRNALTLHVSQGIAGKHPVRYGCVPEIGRLVLRTATDASPRAADAEAALGSVGGTS